MSYNPNEIVRCRHIVALAEHLGDKLELILNGAVGAEDTRPTPTLTLSKTTMSISGDGLSDGSNTDVTYSGDGQLYVKSAPEKIFCGWMVVASNKLRVIAHTTGAQPGTVTIAATGTDNYKPVEATITITA